jgi:hypothetical protein
MLMVLVIEDRTTLSLGKYIISSLSKKTYSMALPKAGMRVIRAISKSGA